MKRERYPPSIPRITEDQFDYIKNNGSRFEGVFWFATQEEVVLLKCKKRKYATKSFKNQKELLKYVNR